MWTYDDYICLPISARKQRETTPHSNCAIVRRLSYGRFSIQGACHKKHTHNEQSTSVATLFISQKYQEKCAQVTNLDRTLSASM